MAAAIVLEDGSIITFIYSDYFSKGYRANHLRRYESCEACEQALRGPLAAEWEKKGGLATTSLEFDFDLQFPCGSPLTELSDFRQLARM